jgi:hypothetical protein
MATTHNSSVNATVDLVMRGGALASIDPATGAGVLVRSGGARWLDVVHVGPLVLGAGPEILIRMPAGDVDVLPGTPRLLAFRLPGRGWVRDPALRSRRPDPRQPGRWVATTDAGELLIIDRVSGAVTAIASPLQVPDLAEPDAEPHLLPGSTIIPISWEGGARTPGDELDVVVLFDIASDPEVARATAGWHTSMDLPGGLSAGRLTDAAIFLPDDQCDDYRQWGGWPAPHDSPEWADPATLPGWRP